MGKHNICISYRFQHQSWERTVNEMFVLHFNFSHLLHTPPPFLANTNVFPIFMLMKQNQFISKLDLTITVLQPNLHLFGDEFVVFNLFLHSKKKHWMWDIGSQAQSTSYKMVMITFDSLFMSHWGTAETCRKLLSLDGGCSNNFAICRHDLLSSWTTCHYASISLPAGDGLCAAIPKVELSSWEYE